MVNENYALSPRPIPTLGAYLVRLGRKRWAIEGFFKTAQQQFGLHCFGQGTKLGVYRWLILSLIAYLFAHGMARSDNPLVLNWKDACQRAVETLLPAVAWCQLLRHLRVKNAARAELTQAEKDENQCISQQRVYVEHVIRAVKIFRIAKEVFRMRSERYETAISCVCGIVRLRAQSV